MLCDVGQHVVDVMVQCSLDARDFLTSLGKKIEKRHGNPN